MRDKSPCIYPSICQKRYPGCQDHCETGKPYFQKIKEENERIKAERSKDIEFAGLKVDRVYESKKRNGSL